jgi:hypothetical protein
VVADACRALAAAHEAGLIHRDIKPGNILRADSGLVKLSDFGLAKPSMSSKSGLTITQQDMMIGTPLYMSPEQCENKPLDARSDIYSLGATYFALLTGSPPYCTGTALQILYAHCHAPVPDVNEHLPGAGAPAACGRIIRKAMAKNAGDRYTTARDMLVDLEALLNGAAVADDDSPMAGALATLGQSGTASGALQRLPDLPGARPRGGASKMPLWIGAGALAAIALLVGVVIAVNAGGDDTPVTTETPNTVATPEAARISPPIAQVPQDVAPTPNELAMAPPPPPPAWVPEPAAPGAGPETAMNDTPPAPPDLVPTDVPPAPPEMSAAPRDTSTPPPPPTTAPAPKATPMDPAGSAEPLAMEIPSDALQVDPPLRQYAAARVWMKQKSKAGNEVLI